MTNDKEKEEALDKRKELREKFNEWIDGYDILHGVKTSVGSRDHFFNWLTADHEISYNNKLLDKISHLESIIQAADEVVETLHQDRRPNWVRNTDETYEAIEKYNELKKQQ